MTSPAQVQITAVRAIGTRYEVQRTCGHLQYLTVAPERAPVVGDTTACLTCSMAGPAEDEPEDDGLVLVTLPSGSCAWLRREATA